jgi:hypothetical protein
MTKLRHLLFDHFGWKVLSLWIAVVIWALVASEPEISTFANARLEYRNMPDDLEIASDPISTVSLELRGPSGALRGLGGDGIRAEVVLDMAGVRPGEHTFPIGDRNAKLPRGVTLVRALPSEVRFDFEKQAPPRNVPVQARFTGLGANGYVLESAEIIPKEVTIVGPTTHVSRVSAVVTDPVDVSGVVGTAEFRVNAFVEEPYVRLKSPSEVVVRVTMKRK